MQSDDIITCLSSIAIYSFVLQCQDVAAFLQYRVALLPEEQYQKVQKVFCTAKVFHESIQGKDLQTFIK